MAKERSLDDKAFIRGYACAVAIMLRLEGDITSVRELFRDGIGTLKACIDCSVDPYDMEVLR